MKIDDPLLQNFFDGDRLGAPAEGMPGATVSYEELMRRQHEHPHGSDESDLVRCFMAFSAGWQWSGDYEDFAVEWSRYIAHHHRVTSYGKTWRDFFATVKVLARSGHLTYDRLLPLSRDRKSCGNGLLALAYPSWRYAQATGADPYKLARVITLISHSHPAAQSCVAALIEHFETGAPIAPTCFPPQGREADFTHLAPGALWAAWTFSQEQTKEEVIRRACEIGGDLDSTLSLSLLLWSFSRQKLLKPRRVLLASGS